MSILSDLIQQDGSVKTLILHKLVHISVGAIAALLVLHLTGSFELSVITALIVGIIREFQKTATILLHIVVALITASGAFLASLLFVLPGELQVVSVFFLVIYVLVISLEQLNENNQL